MAKKDKYGNTVLSFWACLPSNLFTARGHPLRANSGNGWHLILERGGQWSQPLLGGIVGALIGRAMARK